MRKTLAVHVRPMKGCYEKGHKECARYFIAISYQQGGLEMRYDKLGEGMPLHEAIAYSQSITSMIKEENRG